ncbi:MAG TPA: histidine triad nucleotide-binding protein [Longimicrobiales bacterium]|nr:histidine triad nucleotide-binding protein [Longimicrobiales bacterium]
MAHRDCVFCRIVDGDIQAEVLREDDDTLAFRDLDPKAPVHVLVIPKRHIASVNDVTESDRTVMGSLFLAARDVARREQLAERGYRVVMNTGADAGQSVDHAHLHVLGGRQMTWPPG